MKPDQSSSKADRPQSRRDFLRQTTQAGLLSGLVASPHLLQGAAMADSHIDAHVHVWTPDIKSYPLGKGYKKEQMKPASFTPEELFAHCRPHGVQRIVLIQMSYYGFDNRYMLDMIKKHSGVFSGVAVIDEDDRPARTMQKLAARECADFAFARVIGQPTAGSTPRGWRPCGKQGPSMTWPCVTSASPGRFRLSDRCVDSIPRRQWSLTISAGWGLVARSPRRTWTISVSWQNTRTPTSRSPPSMHWARSRPLTQTWYR